MAKTRVKLNTRGVGEVLRSTGMAREVKGLAESAAARARSSAPVQSGDYGASIFVVSDVTDRAVARVATSAAHGMVVEANTGNLARSIGGRS